MRQLLGIVLVGMALGASQAGVPLQDRPELAWWRESMQTRDQRLAWWREARFGMFIHWGVYSLPAGVWDGQPVRGYAEHIQRIRKIPIAVYREQVAARFNPVRFNADEWVSAAKRAGMGYLIITAKHHDGFAMYDSAVSDYNIIKATPFGRDPMRELKDACTRHGLRFGFYYSHAFDWGDANGPGNDWDYENPGGDRLLHGANWWEKAPELLPRIRSYVDAKAIPQVRELIRKYDPDILWFDTPHKLPAEENLRILRAAREAKPTLVINGRAVQVVPGGPPARFGDYMSTADRPAELIAHEGDWEGIPTTNESYGHHKADNSHKPSEHFIRLIANAAERGGNLLLNIGPMGDGAIDPKDLAILDGIGKWMNVNAESIRATERTPLPVQNWGHSTRKGNRLYVHVFDWPENGRLPVAGLRSDIASARLLARTEPLTFRRLNHDDVEIHVPRQQPDPWDAVIVLESKGDIAANPARLVSVDAPTTLHVFHGRLAGGGIRYGDGKRLRDSTVGWNDAESGVDWHVRVAQPGRFRVSVNYASGMKADPAAFEIRFGDRVVKGVVPPTATDDFTTFELGNVALTAGEFTVSIRPVIAREDFLRLRAIELMPLPAKTPVVHSDVPEALRKHLPSHADDAKGFDAFVREIDRRTADRVAAGEREQLVYFILQSTRFTALPRIEPALAAKAFVDAGATRVPGDVSRRVEAFLAERNDRADARVAYFSRLLPAGPREQRRAFLAAAYGEAMKFLYEKEFAAANENVAQLYQQRAHSTDTAFEANYPVDHALRLIAKRSGQERLNRALIVGPGLDLAPRTDLVDTVPPQSFQPFAVADTLLDTRLADRAALHVHSVDTSEAVVAYLSAAAVGKIARLSLFSGLTDDPHRRLADDYRRYFAAFGRQIGIRSGEQVASRDHRLWGTLEIDAAIARQLSADRLNIITERYRPSPAYDVVVATNVFAYFTDAELALALANVAGMLRPGGYLIHNDARPAAVALAGGAGLEPLHARGLAIASGPGGNVSDGIWIHRRR